MPKLYFISGLGADSRAFTLIKEFDTYQSVFLEWIPNHKNESISSYTSRMLEGCIFSENDVIVGLSFGGLIAIEAAYQYPIKKIILLSSFRDKRDLKWFNQILLHIRAYKLIPNFKIKSFDKLALKFFSIKSPEGKEGLLDMMQQTEPTFTKWALNEIRKSNFKPARELSIFNIIGAKDKLVKLWLFEENDFIINKGGHLMVYEKADEINNQLESILKKV